MLHETPWKGGETIVLTQMVYNSATLALQTNKENGVALS